MSALSATFDEPLAARRTGWSMTASIVVHALLLLAFALAPKPAAEAPVLTEITLLDPGDPGSGTPEPAQAAPAAPQSGALVEQHGEVRFRREAHHADVEPDPQNDVAVGDKIEARLAALQSRDPQPTGVAVASPVPSWGTAAVPAGSGAGGSAPIALTRGSGGGTPLVLVRGSGSGTSSAFTPASVAPPRSEEAAAPAHGGDVTAHRTLAGVTLMGPIADRAVLSHPAPVYPEWAKREAVEGRVSLYFVVRADGTVKDNVLVQKTAGFEDFDESARVALRAWRFEPLPRDRTGEQWGTITFHFRLQEGG